MRHLGIEFDEITIPLAQENTHEELLRYSPSGKCPALHDGEIVVWDSLAIIEYLAESFLQAPVWPEARAARAQARALAAEMHSGFASLRAALPMNMRRKSRNARSPPRRPPMLSAWKTLSQKLARSLAEPAAFSSGIFPRPTQCLRP